MSTQSDKVWSIWSSKGEVNIVHQGKHLFITWQMHYPEKTKTTRPKKQHLQDLLIGKVGMKSQVSQIRIRRSHPETQLKHSMIRLSKHTYEPCLNPGRFLQICKQHLSYEHRDAINFDRWLFKSTLEILLFPQWEIAKFTPSNPSSHNYLGIDQLLPTSLPFTTKIGDGFWITPMTCLLWKHYLQLHLKTSKEQNHWLQIISLNSSSQSPGGTPFRSFIYPPPKKKKTPLVLTRGYRFKRSFLGGTRPVLWIKFLHAMSHVIPASQASCFPPPSPKRGTFRCFQCFLNTKKKATFTGRLGGLKKKIHWNKKL